MKSMHINETQLNMSVPVSYWRTGVPQGDINGPLERAVHKSTVNYEYL